MAILSRGIVEGQMAWPLIIVGMLMGLGFVLMQVKSPMLVSVGMYLPLETTFAIFVGGLIKGVVDLYNKNYKYNPAQMARVENTGILLASGLIAGEALMGLIFAALRVFNVFPPEVWPSSPFTISLVVLLAIALILIMIPLRNAGSPDEPAPPSAVM